MTDVTRVLENSSSSDLGDLAWQIKIPIAGCKRQHDLSKVYGLILLLHCSKYIKGKIQIKLQKQTCCIEQTGKYPLFHLEIYISSPGKNSYRFLWLSRCVCCSGWLVCGKPGMNNKVKWVFVHIAKSAHSWIVSLAVWIDTIRQLEQPQTHGSNSKRKFISINLANWGSPKNAWAEVQN